MIIQSFTFLACVFSFLIGGMVAIIFVMKPDKKHGFTSDKARLETNKARLRNIKNHSKEAVEHIKYCAKKGVNNTELHYYNLDEVNEVFNHLTKLGYEIKIEEKNTCFDEILYYLTVSW